MKTAFSAIAQPAQVWLAQRHYYSKVCLTSSGLRMTHVHQGISGKHCNAETIVLMPEEFSAKFMDMLNHLNVHHSISEQQASYFRYLIAN